MVAQGNVGLAFGLVCAAGLSTTLGAAVVFCASLAQPRLLAISLGFAAGVMLYVSFAEIFMRKSVDGFTAVELDADAAYRYSTLCFFGGMLIIFILDRIVHLITDWAARRSSRAARMNNISTANLLAHAQPSGGEGEDSVSEQGAGAQAGGGGTSSSAAKPCIPPVPPGSPRRTVRSDKVTEASDDVEAAGAAAASDGADAGVTMASMDLDVPQDALQVAAVQEQAAQQGTTSRQAPAVVEIMKRDHHNFALKKMGILTAAAIFIHNFPEGLAVFSSALADTSIGIGIALAIALHNIPEGICVAMPIYYATGSKTKGFMWAVLSGISEPIGGLVGYLALSSNNELAFAIVFGLVAGMMVYISIKELIPTALKYDPDDKVVTTSVVAGMVVIAGSLLLFTI